MFFGSKEHLLIELWLLSLNGTFCETDGRFPQRQRFCCHSRLNLFTVL